MEKKAEIMDEVAISRAITRISFEILERNRGSQDLCVIGIRNGGVPLAKRIAAKLSEQEKREIPIGSLDITLYRDDVKVGEEYVDASEIPFDITGKKIVLVDDVIYTGRSVRAAIDALMKRGRPTNIQLATLVDRGHREIPIRPDYIGKNLPTSSDEIVRVSSKEVDGFDGISIWG